MSLSFITKYYPSMLFSAFGGFTSSWFVTNFGLRDPAVAIFLLGGLCYIAMGLSNSIALIGLMRFMQGFFSEIFITCGHHFICPSY